MSVCVCTYKTKIIKQRGRYLSIYLGLLTILSLLTKQ